MRLLPPPSSTSSHSAAAIVGSTEPRIFTPPLRELTSETSDGFDVIEFARDTLLAPLDPWQEVAAIRGLELLPDGMPRFHTVLLIAARQNGKTHLPKVLTLFWMFVDQVALVVGSSKKLDYAKKVWAQTVQMAERSPELREKLGRRWKREANGQESFWTAAGSAYEISAANADCARSLTVDRLLMDELRQHRSYEAWSAAEPATTAVPDSQIWATSNAGDDRSVVLNDLREAAIRYIETGEGDDGLCILEWSAPEGSDPLDVHALAQANPNLGRRIRVDRLLGKARKAIAKGGEALTSYQTEYMCIRVPSMDPAVDPAAWDRCADPGDFGAARSRFALCLDVAPDQTHATLVAAAVLVDGRTRVRVVKEWSGQGCTNDVRRDLPGLVADVKPQAFGWFPNGPAAALAADLADRKGRAWPPAGVQVEEIRGEVSAACMGFADLVAAGQIAHPGHNDLLDAHVKGSERLRSGDTWRFSRKGEGHCDAAYAASGSVHLARTLPVPIGFQPLIVSNT